MKQPKEIKSEADVTSGIATPISIFIYLYSPPHSSSSDHLPITHTSHAQTDRQTGARPHTHSKQANRSLGLVRLLACPVRRSGWCLVG